MIVVDTDVLLLAFAFQRDERQPANAAFLQQVQARNAATTIYNVLELLGKLSFNLAPERLDAWHSWLVDAYQLTVLWPFSPGGPTSTLSFREEIFERPFARMRAVQMPFMDALILNLADRIPGVTHFVTWNARRFQDKSGLLAMTPEEYLERAANEGQQQG